MLLKKSKQGFVNVRNSQGERAPPTTVDACRPIELKCIGIRRRTMARVDKRGETSEIRISPNEFAWPADASPSVGTSLMGEVETMVLKGDPSKSGLYTILL